MIRILTNWLFGTSSVSSHVAIYFRDESKNVLVGIGSKGNGFVKLYPAKHQEKSARPGVGHSTIFRRPGGLGDLEFQAWGGVGPTPGVL